MPVRLMDDDVQRLLAEKKPLPKNYDRHMKLKPKRGHKESQLDVKGVAGPQFSVIVRQAEANPLDFSVILAYKVPRSNQVILLRRYNGKSHQHTNPIERETFYDFHVHELTERYQDSADKDETFATPTRRYSSWPEAIESVIIDCGFELPDDPQPRLF